MAMQPATPKPATAPDVPDPRVEAIVLESTVLGVAKTFYVYTPPGYEESEEPVPSLYFFRGQEQEWLNPEQDESLQGFTLLDAYEELLDAGQVGPMVLVFPGIGSDDGAVPGVLTDFVAPELAEGHPGVGTGRFETYFIEELIPYVDSHYRTLPQGGARGVAGFSLGGFMSTKIALQYPEMFGSVSAFDGLYFFTDDDCRVAEEPGSIFEASLFDAAFGKPRDIEHTSANNSPTIVCRSDPGMIQSIDWFIQYGPEAAEPNDSNFYRGQHFVELLEVNGVQNRVTPVLSGGHNWHTAVAHMQQTLPLHWATLSDAVLVPAAP
ncbi:MAG: esterase [Ardenticatenales bacterium]|nr:esterase [Ardenticatenales bacterium]